MIRASRDVEPVGDECVDSLLGEEHEEGDGVSLWACGTRSNTGRSVVMTLAAAIKLGGYSARLGCE